MGADEGHGGSSTVVGLLPGSATTATLSEQDGAASQIAVSNGLWVVNDKPRAVGLYAAGVNGTVPIPALPGSSR